MKIRVDNPNVHKLRFRMNEQEKEVLRNLREFKNLSKETLKELFLDENLSKEEIFDRGFDIAKEMIIKFLFNKQMGYGETFFFKISDIEEIGESIDPCGEIESHS